MKIYTLQHKAVYEELLKKGVYRPSKKRICDPSFEYAYNWLSRMSKKYRGYECPRPIWGWLKRPDMRSQRWIRDPEQDKIIPVVLLTLEVPDDKVLLTEFDLWHHVLCNTPVVLNHKQNREWDKILKPYGEYVSNRVPKRILEKLELTWELIVKENLKSYSKDYVSEPRYQATFPEIRLDQVIKVENFKFINKA